MDKREKKIMEYILEDGQVLILEEDEVSTRVHHYDKEKNTSKMIAMGPKNLENADEEMEKIAKQFLELQKKNAHDVNEKKLLKEVSGIWKTCTSETEFLSKIAFFVAAALKQSYEEIGKDPKACKFKVEDQNPNVNALHGMHIIGEILNSAQHKDGKVNAVEGEKASPF